MRTFTSQVPSEQLNLLLGDFLLINVCMCMCASVNVIVEKVLSNMMNLTIKDEMKVVFVCLRKLFNHQRVSNLCKSNMIRISTNISYFRLSSSARDKAFVDSHYIYIYYDYIMRCVLSCLLMDTSKKGTCFIVGGSMTITQG